MSLDGHFVIYPLGTDKHWKNDVNMFHKLAYFISRGIGSSQIGPYLENGKWDKTVTL